MIVLPPLFLHFALVFPERPHMPGYSATLARWLPAIYLPGAVLGSTRALAVLRSGFDPEYFVRVIALLDRLEYIYFAIYLGAGLAVLVRALTRARSVTVKRQLRWIVWGTTLGALPFALGYAIPFALGADPSIPMGLSAVPLGFVPLAFASAIIRYRLMDVEIILKRLLIYTSAVAAIVAIYVLILRASGGYLVEGESQHRWIIAFLATVVVILLAKPVKDGLQNAIDRAFYRDRYDYRRALVGFARELNSDLDLNRLADRMVTRVRETIELDRMAFLLATDEGDFESISHEGFEAAPPKLAALSGIASRLHSAHTVRLDDPLAATTVRQEMSSGATTPLLTSCRAWRKTLRSPCWRSAAAPAANRDHRGHRARHRGGCAGRHRHRERASLIVSCTSRPRSSIGSTPSTKTSSTGLRRWPAGDRAR